MSKPEKASAGTRALDFLQPEGPNPHGGRARSIILQHPEIRDLVGKNPWTFWITFGIVAAQTVVAALVAPGPWWMILLVAVTFGAFANHALWVVIHEVTHNLIFKTPRNNTLVGILANLPHGAPTSVFFQRYHMKHHAFLGAYDFDADLPSHWEFRLFGRSAVGKATWLFLFAIMQALRPTRLRVLKPIDRWVVINVVAQVTYDAALVYFFGWQALAYLFVSLLFSVGLHPLGARWIQEHYIVFPGQETVDYYGPLNKVAFNVGYHNEHHDFPSIPWNRLPAIKCAAPEAYDTLHYHSSWTKLIWQFITDPRLSLRTRYVREGPTGGARLDEAKAANQELREIPEAQIEVSEPLSA
jgi:sphingolipid 4-desaturase/C4-monooxygenase